MWPSGIHRKNSTSVCSLYRVSGSPASFSPRGAFHEHFSTKRVNSWPAVDVGSTFSPSGPAGVHGLATPETPSSRTVMTSHWDHLSAWLRNDSLGVQLIFYWLTILLVPIFDCFLFVWASVICPWGCKDPKGGHHREMLNFLTFWSFLPKRATRSQLEKGRSQWWVGPSPAHCRPFCSWRDKWVANRLLVPDFPGVTQTCSQTQRSDRTILNFFFFLRETLFRNFSPWENPLFGSDQKGWVIERLFCHGPVGREKAVLLFPTDLREDKCNQLQVIKLLVIQILETNLLRLKPWHREDVLSKLSCERKGD